MPLPAPRGAVPLGGAWAVMEVSDCTRLKSRRRCFSCMVGGVQRGRLAAPAGLVWMGPRGWDRSWGTLCCAPAAAL